MPGKVKVKIIAGRNLPVMDRSNDTTDAYVELKLGTTTYKTDVCKKSLNPNWNTDWFRFEVDDAELQEEPLQIRLMDYDTYSANDSIGKVYLDLNPLLVPRSGFLPKLGAGCETNSSSEHFTSTVMSGWIPVYDTMHGIRGEVNIIVKVELFSDYNRFRQSSCGVQFFCAPIIPHGYYAKAIHGFVEELIVNDDPEYQWIDKIRTPRASNEARQFLFFKLYGELQRKIGVKTLELGGNAVIGYGHCFDLEGDFGIVARGIGTAVTLIKARDTVTNTDIFNEEQVLNYFQFLRCDNGFHLNRNNPIESVPSRNFALHAPTTNKSNSKYCDTSKNQLHYNSKSTQSLHDKLKQGTSLQTLLQQEDSRCSPASGIKQHFRNVKYSSKNRITRGVNALLARFSNTKHDEGYSSPVMESIRKKKHMAELLVHSVMRTSFDSNENASNILMSDMSHDISRTTGKSVSEPHLDSNSLFPSVMNSSIDSSSSCEDETTSDLPEETSIEYDTVSGIVKNVEQLEPFTSQGVEQTTVEAEVHCGATFAPNTFDSVLLKQSRMTDIQVPNINKLDNELPKAPLATFEEFEINNEPVASTQHHNVFHSIVPCVPPNTVNISDSSLTKIAMQTMLLEKVNIMGTYTPPTSPSAPCKETDIFKLPILKQEHSLHHPASTCVTNTDRNLSPNDLNAVNKPVKTVFGKGDNNMHASLVHSLRNYGSPVADPVRNYAGHQRTESVGGKSSQSPLKSNPFGITHRRSSDSDLSITPKGSSLTGSDKSYGHTSGFIPRLGALSRSGVNQENFDMLDYPFVTMTKFPAGFIINFGGVVSARSVKRLERVISSDEPESRDLWWNELRLEIRAHARSLNCNAVLAYAEHATVCDGICVLSATGTAAVVGDISECSIGCSPNFLKSQQLEIQREKINNKPLSESPESNPSLNYPTVCAICHLPYAGASSILQSTPVNKCTMCRTGKVSDVLLSNTEMPDGMPTVGCGCFIQAYVCRQMKDSRNEPSAKEISDCLPFLEYELHRILMNKIKIKGMNALFGLKVKISIGAKMLVGIATGTGVFLLPLQPLPLPLLVSDHSDKNVMDMQKLLYDTVRINREIYQLKSVDDMHLQQLSPDQDLFEDELPILDPTHENRDCSVLEVDDPEDMEIMNLLMEPRPPDGFHVVNTETVPGMEELEIVKCLQMFTQIWQGKVQHPYNLSKHVNKLLQSVYFKLRRMIPCALCDLQFNVELPEIDEIQLSVIGVALGLSATPKVKPKLQSQLTENAAAEEEAIFILEDDFNENIPPGALHVQHFKPRPKSPLKTRTYIKPNVQEHEWHGVDITSLSYIPGGKVERYLGNLNLFFIRESTSIREEGGISGFIHRFITEVLAIVRSHISALGGNAILAYYMTQCVITHSIHKNQGQCLINVGGDVVFVSYSPEE